MKKAISEFACLIAAYMVMDIGYSTENYLLSLLLKGVAGALFMLAGMIAKND